ncbi:TraB/GumN family protein [Candidatus Woesearchaeota archaeon]|nr:TraB/GumN family protein [Candidatus Woesearchaeota archaeon]
MPELPLVYKLTTDNGTVSIVIGTSHRAPPDIFDADIQRCFDMVNPACAYFEIDPDSLDLSGKEGYGYPLTEDEQRQLYDRRFLVRRLFGTGPDEEKQSDEGFRQWQEKRREKNREECGYDEIKSVDAAVCEAAKARGVPVRGLETYDSAGPFYAAQRTLLTFVNPEHENQRSIDDRNAFLEGDGAGVGRGLHQYVEMLGSNAPPETYERWLKALAKRNDNMAYNSLDHLEDGCIIAVGSAHLIGPDAMIDLYKELGVKVERI